MTVTDTYQIAQYAAGGAGGLLVLAILLQKFLTGWQTNRAETTVLAIMHEELERMGQQNTKLSQELGKLQSEIIQLNQQLRVLTQENQRLHSEVTALTGEVGRLQTLLKQGGSSGLSS
jgi:chromosome segregation ATPase